ncbi:hypothetical protein EON67_09465 [archaeon]|nr:MAG: hypothetical protein EON67_09465 [archaeon]
MDGPVFYDELNSPRYDPQRLVAENVDRYQRIDNLLTQVSAAYASRKWVDVYNLRRVCVQLVCFFLCACGACRTRGVAPPMHTHTTRMRAPCRRASARSATF